VPRCGHDDRCGAGAAAGEREILAATLAAVSGLERVGIDDNYFIIGGDSIHAQITSRAHRPGGRAVADLHSYPTVRELARPSPRDAKSHQTQPFSLSAPKTGILPPDVEIFPLSLLQEGMIFHGTSPLSRPSRDRLGAHQAPFDTEVLRLVIRQLVQRHPMLRVVRPVHVRRPCSSCRTFADPLCYEPAQPAVSQRRAGSPAGWQQRKSGASSSMSTR
jgi:nonribosomal peptide synthetase protein BlmX